MTSLHPTAPSPVPGHVSPEDALNECIARTAEALGASGVVDTSDIAAGARVLQDSLLKGRPADLVECVARAQGHGEEHLGEAILKLSDSLSALTAQHPPMLPFAGKLITPTAFYESYREIHELSKMLLVPVIYAEDTDAIGIASINPVASSILVDGIVAAVERRVGIRPFVTIARIDYESWAFLCRKHFVL